MIKFRFAALIWTLLLTSPVLGGEIARTIEWEDLVPKMEPMEDPFYTLTTEQLLDLEFLVSARKKKQRDKFSDVHAIFEKAIEVGHNLTRQGLDVAGLIAAYDRWEQEIAKRSQMANIKFDGQFVRIPGYALPLEHKDMGVTEFLLVPYVGACIHVPPPPPNQMVYVSLKDAYTFKDLYEPVWITGRLSIKATNKSLSLVDGSAGVETAYTLTGINIAPYIVSSRP